MALKQEHYIAGLVGIGAIIVLYLLWHESQATATAAPASAVPVPSGAPTYPSAQPIHLGNVTLGATPEQIASLAQLNPVAVDTSGPCGCDDNDCDEAGVTVTVQKIPEAVLKHATSQLSAFLNVPPSPMSGVENARVAFGTARLAAPAKVSNNVAPVSGGASFAA